MAGMGSRFCAFMKVNVSIRDPLRRCANALTVNPFRSADAPLDAAPGPLDHAWRVTAVGMCFVVFGLATGLVTLWLLVVIRPLPFVSSQRKCVWVQGWFLRLSRWFVDLAQALGLMRYTIENAERLRRPARPDRPGRHGQLIVANHPSLIDALFIIGHTPGVCCIVKRELLDNPFTSWLVRSAGYLANESDSLLDDAVRVLHDGRSLLIFPEGTRNPSDLSLRFRRGAAHVAIAADTALLPVTIDFSPRAMQKGQPWYALPGRASRVRLVVHPPFDAVARARASLPDDAPVTVLARRTNDRLREYFLEQALQFADPQGLPDARADRSVGNEGDAVEHPGSRAVSTGVRA